MRPKSRAGMCMEVGPASRKDYSSSSSTCRWSCSSTQSISTSACSAQAFQEGFHPEQTLGGWREQPTLKKLERGRRIFVLRENNGRLQQQEEESSTRAKESCIKCTRRKNLHFNRGLTETPTTGREVVRCEERSPLLTVHKR